MLSLSGIIGHRPVTMLLAQAIRRGTLPPTLLVAGPSGVGKFRLARAIAAALNCTSPVHDHDGLAVDACGACRSCERIERGVHVDVLVLEPDERASIKIDVVRDALERTAFRPFEGRRRVVIIRDADGLEPAAQNALLKSLEEPPAATVFVLTSAVPDVLLPTVRSRCMRLRVGRLTDSEVAGILVREYGMSEHEAREAAALAGGRVGEALALRSTDAMVLREAALLMLQQAARSDAVQSRLQAAAVLTTGSSKKDRTREELSLVLRTLASMLRDVELINAGGDPRGVANGAALDQLTALAPRYAGDRARAAFNAVGEALAALDRNAGIKVVGEWLAVQM